MDEEITGLIIKAWESPNKKGQIQYYVRMDDQEVYSGFGSLPEAMKQGAYGTLSFKRSGDYRNITGFKAAEITEFKVAEQPKQKPEPAHNPEIAALIRDKTTKLLDESVQDAKQICGRHFPELQAGAEYYELAQKLATTLFIKRCGR